MYTPTPILLEIRCGSILKCMKIAISTLSFLFILLLPFQTHAALGVGFGGHVISVIPCTCSGGQVVTYDRFFANTSLPTFGVTLFYQPPAPVFGAGGLLRSLFPLAPFTWHLGSFIPTSIGPIGAIGLCTEGIAPVCTPIPTPPINGIIEYVGTSGPSL